MSSLARVLSYMRKAVVALVGAEIGWASASLQHGFGGVTFTEWIAQSVIVATACGVYVAPNAPYVPPVAVKKASGS